MLSEIISRKTRQELREYFVGTTLGIIRDEFSAAGLNPDENYNPPVSGQRRSLVEQYYKAIDWGNFNDVRKFIAIYENTLIELQNKLLANPSEEWIKKSFANLLSWIERDGFTYHEKRLTHKVSSHDLINVAAAIGFIDLPELNRQMARLQSSVENDPGLAIGTAKELIETVCKTILDQRDVNYSDSADVGELVKETRKVLGLIPESINNSAKGADSIRRLLSNLGNIAQGLGELRNMYGTGHGKSGKTKGLSARHARLAVGSAATLATFLLETHTERDSA